MSNLMNIIVNFVLKAISPKMLCLYCLLAISQWAFLSNGQNNPDIPFSPELVATSLKETLAALTSSYVYPEIALDVESEMLNRLNYGAYKEITTRSEFVTKISSELRELTNDGHLSIYAAPDQRTEPTYVIEETIDRFKYNFGFESVRVLEGNIGYLKLNKFYEELDARSIADSALMFLQHVDALVIDLRENKGGSPDLVQYLLSYFFEEDALLWSIVDRNLDIVFEARSVPEVALTSFRQNYPVVIITTEDTASAAEMFAYTLKHAGKAEIIGQTTMGIAHLVGAGRINEFLNWRFSLSRPVNPTTQTSWERVGVQPNIFASDEELLEVAHARALEILDTARNISQ